MSASGQQLRGLSSGNTPSEHVSSVSLVRVAAEKKPPGRASSVAPVGARRCGDHHIPGMTQFELTEDELEGLARLLRDRIDGDRYPLSPGVQVLKAILQKISPEPERELLPPLRNYEPPRMGRYRRRG
jgi:hypothetical protein